jgi:hypothetical protein
MSDIVGDLLCLIKISNSIYIKTIHASARETEMFPWQIYSIPNISVHEGAHHVVRTFIGARFRENVTVISFFSYFLPHKIPYCTYSLQRELNTLKVHKTDISLIPI